MYSKFVFVVLSCSFSAMAARNSRLADCTKTEPLTANPINMTDTLQNIHDTGNCVGSIFWRKEMVYLGSCDCMRNITSLSFACNRYTLVMDLNQCLQRKLNQITSSSDVVYATELEMVHDIATSLRLLHRMAELYNNVELQTTGNKCSETYTDCATSRHNTMMYGIKSVITRGVKTREFDLQTHYSCNFDTIINRADCHFCRELLDQISTTKRCIK